GTAALASWQADNNASRWQSALMYVLPASSGGWSRSTATRGGAPFPLGTNPGPPVPNQSFLPYLSSSSKKASRLSVDASPRCAASRSHGGPSGGPPASVHPSTPPRP